MWEYHSYTGDVPTRPLEDVCRTMNGVQLWDGATHHWVEDILGPIVRLWRFCKVDSIGQWSIRIITTLWISVTMPTNWWHFKKHEMPLFGGDWSRVIWLLGHWFHVAIPELFWESLYFASYGLCVPVGWGHPHTKQWFKVWAQIYLKEYLYSLWNTESSH